MQVIQGAVMLVNVKECHRRAAVIVMWTVTNMPTAAMISIRSAVLHHNVRKTWQYIRSLPK